MPALSRLLPEEAVEAIGGGLQLDVSPGALAAWLLGSLTPGGFNFVPYRDLTGGRSTRTVGLAEMGMASRIVQCARAAMGSTGGWQLHLHARYGASVKPWGP